MEPKFPTDLPKTSVQQLYKFATRQDPDLGKAALAAWQILGYAGHLTFGDVSLNLDMPLTQAGPPDWAAVCTAATDDGNTIIPPELIDLAVNVLVRWLKKRLGVG